MQGIGFQGGPHIIQKKSQDNEFAGRILGNKLVTTQTGAAGKLCNAVMLYEMFQINAEFATSWAVEKAELEEAEKSWLLWKHRRPQALCSFGLGSRHLCGILCERVDGVGRCDAGHPK